MMEHPERFELSTPDLEGRCSTPELRMRMGGWGWGWLRRRGLNPLFPAYEASEIPVLYSRVDYLVMVGKAGFEPAVFRL